MQPEYGEKIVDRKSLLERFRPPRLSSQWRAGQKASRQVSCFEGKLLCKGQNVKIFREEAITKRPEWT
jgi:hypothetical protein